MLIDRGQLDVNKKVSEYWPEYGCNGKENTKVIDFLCHRACNFGFQNGIPSDSWQNWNHMQTFLQNKSHLQNQDQCKAIMQ